MFVFVVRPARVTDLNFEHVRALVRRLMTSVPTERNAVRTILLNACFAQFVSLHEMVIPRLFHFFSSFELTNRQFQNP